MLVRKGFLLLVCILSATAPSGFGACQPQAALDYADAVERRLDRWETWVNRLQRRGDRLAERQWHLASDLELLLKDARGDVEELRDTCRRNENKLLRGLDRKMSDARRSIADLQLAE